MALNLDCRLSKFLQIPHRRNIVRPGRESRAGKGYRANVLLKAKNGSWVSYPMVHYAGEARGYATMVLAALAAMYLLQTILEDPNPAPNPWRILAFITVSLLGFAAHLSFAVIETGLGIWAAAALFQRLASPLSAAARLTTLFGVQAIALTAYGAVAWNNFTVGGGKRQRDKDDVQRPGPVQRSPVRPVGARQRDIEPAAGLDQPEDADQPRIAVAVGQVAVNDDVVADQPPDGMNEGDRGQNDRYGQRRCKPFWPRTARLTLFFHSSAFFRPHPHVSGFPRMWAEKRNDFLRVTGICMILLRESQEFPPPGP